MLLKVLLAGRLGLLAIDRVLFVIPTGQEVRLIAFERRQLKRLDAFRLRLARIACGYDGGQIVEDKTDEVKPPAPEGG